jgi:hypothetical protein
MREIFSGFPRHKVALCTYNHGVVDYADGKPAISQRQELLQAVVLPFTVAREFWKGLVSYNDRIERIFVIKQCNIPITVGQFLLYDGPRYNIKDILVVDGYFLLHTTAQRDNVTREVPATNNHKIQPE